LLRPHRFKYGPAVGGGGSPDVFDLQTAGSHGAVGAEEGFLIGLVPGLGLSMQKLFDCCLIQFWILRSGC
jgi:hypothetical protein